MLVVVEAVRTVFFAAAFGDEFVSALPRFERGLVAENNP